MKLTIYNTYVVMNSQEQCNRMKQLCIDYGLPIWVDAASFVFDTEYGNEFYCSVDPNKIGVEYGFTVLYLSGKTQITEYQFKELLTKHKTMKEFKITEEQIKEVYFGGGLILKQWFPEVFETKFKNGDWIYCFEEEAEALVCITDLKNTQAYGFTITPKGYFYRNETESSGWTFNSNPETWRLATEEEVFEALKNEAIKRGFKNGCYYINTTGYEFKADYDAKCYFNYDDERGFTLDCGDGQGFVFGYGKWAKIIPTLTKEEAEKKLNVKIIY